MTYTREQFLEKVLSNGYKPEKPNMLLIPESRQRPFTKSKLYRKVMRFLKEQNLEKEYHIIFISNLTGVCPEEFAEQEIFLVNRAGGFPSSGVVRETGEIIGRYLEKTKSDYEERIVYARGSYLTSVKLGSYLSKVAVESILSNEDLERMRKWGIKWMKIGLRLPAVFSVFEKRMKGITRSESPQTELFNG